MHRKGIFQVVLRQLEVGVNSQGFTVTFNGLVKSALMEQGASQIVMGIRQIRLES